MGVQRARRLLPVVVRLPRAGASGIGRFLGFAGPFPEALRLDRGGLGRLAQGRGVQTGTLGAGHDVGELPANTLHVRFCGRERRPRGRDRRGEPDLPRASVRGTAHERGRFLFRVPRGRFGGLTRRMRTVEVLARPHDPFGQLFSLDECPGGLFLEGLRVPVRGGGFLGTAQQPTALLGQRRQRPVAVAHRAQFVPARAGCVQFRGGARGTGLGLVQPLGEIRGRGLELGLAFARRAARVLVRVHPGARRHEIVREQTGARIADVVLDPLRLAGRARLAAQGRELTLDLTGEVLEPVQVRLHRFELAQGLLLAAAVLEDP